MLQLTENKQRRPVLIENFEPSDCGEKSSCPPCHAYPLRRSQHVTPALRSLDRAPAGLQCPQEARTIYNANAFGGGTIDQARVPDSFGHPFTRFFRDYSKRARGRTQDRDGQISQWEGDHRRISGDSREAWTLSRGDRHPRMVGAERLGEGANA